MESIPPGKGISYWGPIPASRYARENHVLI